MTSKDDSDVKGSGTPPETGVAARLKRAARASVDRALGRRLVNIAHVLSGNFAGTLLGLVAFALTARTLGAFDYGVLALIHTYVRAVERLVAFQSWQPLIKYGAGLDAPERREDFKVLMKYGFMLDLAGSVAAWSVAVGIALLAGPLFGWSEATSKLLLIYASLLLFNVTGMPTAVVRLAGRFKLIAYSQVSSSVIRLVFTVVGYWLDAGLLYFVVGWTLLQVVSSATLFGIAMFELRRREALSFWRAPLRGVGARFPNIWNFAWTSNLTSTIRMSTHELDTLLVGWLADPAAAGLYHIAKRIGRMAELAGSQVQTVLYPEVARFWAAGQVEAFRRAVVQMAAILFGLGLVGVAVLMVIGEPLLRIVAGHDFVAAAPLLVIQMLAVTLALTSASLRSALFAMGRQKAVLKLVLGGALVFHATALVLIPVLGPMGANIAHLVLGTIVMVGMALRFRYGLTRGPGPDAVSSGAVPAPAGE
ncbi:lipopolysaccharide biosynthesis protein [Prosthecomicrobium sp. N25]|uniref:lipopolysaccharide biosynthesis protein n=1 Tax=Prosthecomicrobium sp. N25 TaxID=3129254 RepID=UPI003076FCB6